MTNNEALQAAEKECSISCSVCTEEIIEKCWIHNAKVALFYSIPEKPLVKGYRDTPYGKAERLYCSHCQRPLKNDNKFKFCPRCGKAIDWGNE